ncbi:MAG: 2OG-Fe(II) oxygenase [Acetobacteraceae bacterium]
MASRITGWTHSKKRRRDWLLQPGDGVHERVLALLFGRCIPEIRRAFQHAVSHTDRILVARYDETGGYFRRHRDNVGKGVAFRQFALSVNLNSDAYEGGHLLFPEYNDHRYRPATGEGIVFSASLLHEATPVTRGCRYVLLTFLHDAAAEALSRGA